MPAPGGADPRAAALREELNALKPSEVRKQARAAGVTDDAMDAVTCVSDDLKIPA